jgi:glutaminyl-tRNA synthetase
MYRIMHVPHFRQHTAWVIYPMYDYAHPISDALEGITHSLCTLEFEDHRPLYDWFIDNLPLPYRPVQIEFARLNLSYTVLSKRKLLTLVNDKIVGGWDDPRMPTLSGLRRRGYTPEAIRNFCDAIGVAKRDAIVDVAQLEHAIRNDLNKRSPRLMAVLRPLRVVIENYPEDQTEELDAVNNPEDLSAGIRKVPFSRVLYIEQEDFRENPPKQFYRLAPGREVRLRYAYFITCKDVVKDSSGNIIELRCTYDPQTRGGDAPPGKPSPKATLHWVSANEAMPVEVRLYDRLFNEERPDNDSPINPSSLEVLTRCYVEPSVKNAKPLDRYQFERLGYFCVDADSNENALVFNRTVTLRDTWAKIEKSLKK